MDDDPMKTGVSDEQLIAIARGELDPIPEFCKSMADQLLKHRRRLRHDSRRAEQIKKLRWGIEHILSKMEHLTIAVRAEEKEEQADG